MSTLYDVYIGLGANLGARRKAIRRALDAVGDLPDTRLVDVSDLYETRARFVEDQPDFINACAHLQTSLTPEQLLDQLLLIEKDMGRVRGVRRGPRVIDLDILFYGDRVIDKQGLTVPHPDLQNRDFVLRPLFDIAPRWVHPVLDKTVRQMLEQLH